MHKIKKDDDMWNYNIRNQYEYSILKLQKWWRKRQFIKMVAKAVELKDKKEPSIDSLKKIELELKILL